MRGGWVAVYRSLLDPDHDMHPSASGEEACRAFAWIDLLGMVRYEDGGGLERGQTRIKQRELATRWNWSRGKVRRFLEKLEDQGRVSTDPQSGPKPTIVTICNYDDYQFSTNGTGPQFGPRGGPTPIYGMKEKQGGRTPARGNGKPAGPGDVTVTAQMCPVHDDEPLRSDSRGLYCVVCGDYVEQQKVPA